MIKVFLGGTCNETSWRKSLIALLNIDYFNPVVDDWNEEAKQKEIYERENCNYVLYVLTPRMTGIYSVAEAVNDSSKRPDKTLCCVLNTDVDDDGKPIKFLPEIKDSLKAIIEMIEKNGATCFTDLADVAIFLNGKVFD